MKILILSGLLISIVTGISLGQSLDSVQTDTQMPQYRVSSCLSDLFADIVKADKPDFNGKESFYSLTFERVNAHRLLNIDHERWNAAIHLDFHGVIRVDGALFLCRGNFDQDSLFQKMDSTIPVKLRRTTDPDDTIPFFRDPSLQGTYLECNGLPISLEVYIENPIPGYRMKERRVKPKN